MWRKDGIRDIFGGGVLRSEEAGVFNKYLPLWRCRRLQLRPPTTSRHVIIAQILSLLISAIYRCKVVLALPPPFSVKCWRSLSAKGISQKVGTTELARERASWRFPKFPLHIEIMCCRPATAAAVALIYGKARKPFLDGDRRMDGRRTRDAEGTETAFVRQDNCGVISTLPPSFTPPTIDSKDAR